MNLSIPAEDLQKIVSEAILRSVDEQTRNTLIQSAIKHLLTPTEAYGSRPRTSPLMDAFNAGIGYAADKIIREQLETDPEIQKKLAELMAEAFEKMLVTDRGPTVDRMAAAFANALTRRD